MFSRRLQRNLQSSVKGLRGATDLASSLVEVALIVPIFILLLSGAVDLGRAWYIKLEITAAAEAGTLYGLGNPTDTAGMQAASSADANDLSYNSTAIYGTECSDGTSQTLQTLTLPTCNAGAVEFVEVDTTLEYVPLLPYPWFPNPFEIQASARMRTLN